MQIISAVVIAALIDAHRQNDEEKFRTYANFIITKYLEAGEERSARIIRHHIDGSYKEQPVVTLE